ncbi:hypothetical protein GGF37_006144, partial [Kickxella alabastrina]
MHFYEQAGDILRRLGRHEGSIKSQTVGNRYLEADDKRRMYALICETLKYATALSVAVERSGIMKEKALSKVTEQMALVMAHDLLISRGGLQHRGADAKLNLAVRKRKEALDKEFKNYMVETGAQSIEDLIPLALRDTATATFRYVRVNLIATTVDAVIEVFIRDGFKLVEDVKMLNVNAHRFMRDGDLSDVLVFPPGTVLHLHPLYVDGSVVLQDKASCMPAHVVQPQPGSEALDACAAPGNKTSHMVSLMANKGRVHAFDMDSRRMQTLVELTTKARCRIIETQCMSFLDVDPLNPKYAQVEYALLDPSCSGSGIVNRMDALVDSYASGGRPQEPQGGRLAGLAEFQISIIMHAMRFPAVKRISYSTCSVHVEENEAVVAAVLAAQDEFGLAPAEQVIPTWKRRGVAEGGLTPEQAACVVRTLPEDGTNGFFVAGFVRQKPADVEATRLHLQTIWAGRPAPQAASDPTQNQHQQTNQKKRELNKPADGKPAGPMKKKPKPTVDTRKQTSSLNGQRARSA